MRIYYKCPKCGGPLSVDRLGEHATCCGQLQEPRAGDIRFYYICNWFGYIAVAGLIIFQLTKLAGFVQELWDVARPIGRLAGSLDWGGFVISLGIWCACGLPALAVGIGMKRRGLGIAAFVSCVLTAWIFGVCIAVPFAAISTAAVLILASAENAKRS